MKKITFNISLKLTITYLIIVLATILSSVFCYYVLSKNKTADNDLRYVSIPSLENLKELKLLMLEVKKQTNNWIYISNKKEKDVLTDIITNKYPVVNKQLIEHSAKWTDDKELTILKSINENNIKIMKAVGNITSNLATEDDYNDDTKLDNAIADYETNVLKLIDINNTSYENLINLKNENLVLLQDNKSFLLQMLITIITILLIVVIVISLFSLIYTKRSITKPLIELKEIIAQVALGEVNAMDKINRLDEIGQMQNAVSDMINGLNQKINFSDEIGKGNYGSEFDLLSEKDKLGSALIAMRNNLQIASIEDAQRNWNSSGLAQLGELLRLNNDDETKFYNSIMSFIVKYCKANQGGIFILNEENPNNLTLDLAACYAYDKRKYVSKQLEIGEGLVGQCYIEKEVIYLTDVPDKYTHITSGLGEATPTCVVLIPLKVNNTVNGVIEIASFKPLEKFEIEFLTKTAESISSTVVTLRINIKTSLLLEQTQQQAEEMRAQEEEMRQNLEELKATQEEFLRKEQSYIDEIAELKGNQNQ